MFTYQSNEARKLQISLNNINLEKMTNKEIVGLYFIGALSFKELLQALDMTENEGMELLKGLSFELSRNIIRDDEESQKDSW